MSRRERQVLVRLAHGCEITEIAEDLGLTSETVRTYTKSAMRKLGARTRSQAIALALVRGEIPPVTARAAGGD